MTGTVLVCALLVAVGLAGIVVPLLPGTVLVALGIGIWAGAVGVGGGGGGCCMAQSPSAA